MIEAVTAVPAVNGIYASLLDRSWLVLVLYKL